MVKKFWTKERRHLSIIDVLILSVILWAADRWLP